jgi:formiminoglutamate deiminase
MITLWCELAWLGGEGATQGVVIEVVGDRIHSVTPGATSAPDGSQRLLGLTLPGFANAHSHAFHRALRGRTNGGPGTFWTWRDAMYEVASALDPDGYYRLARAVYGEMVLAGFTSVGEFHYLHHGPGGVPYTNPNAMGESLIAAAHDAGIRLTLLDTCYLHGGIGADLNTVQQRFADADVDTWSARVAALPDGPDVRIGAAVHSVRACTPQEIRAVASWSAGRPLHAHVSEQPAENQACLDTYRQTPVGVFADAGAVSPQFSAIHATHLTDADIAGLAGATVCFCPTTERDLADGIGPARRLLDAGAALSIGSDSHAVIDPFEETRAIELNERLHRRTRGNIDVAALLDAATRSGHRSIGWDDAGTITPGALADLVTVTLDSVRLAGTRPDDVLAAVIFGASPADVTHVMVGGRAIVFDGRHHSIDVAAELAAVLS